MGSAGHQRKPCAPTTARAFTRSGRPARKPPRHATATHALAPAGGGRLDGRGHSAHRLETGVACAMGEIPVDEGRCELRVSSGNGPEEMGSDTHVGASSGLHLALCSTTAAGIQGDIRVREVPGLAATTTRAGRSPRRLWVHANS
jgi:hypothetical protein